jgi:hypothetical protein
MIRRRFVPMGVRAPQGTPRGVGLIGNCSRCMAGAGQRGSEPLSDSAAASEHDLMAEGDPQARALTSLAVRPKPLASRS